MELNDEFILSLLQSLDIFEDIDNSSIIRLGHSFKERVYSQNEIIFTEGSIGSTMMVIASGEVRVTQKPGPGTEETLMILKKGDIFGEMSLLEDLPRSATVIAHTNTIALEICREDFMDFIDKDNKNGIKILLKLSRILSSRLREANVKLKAFVNFSQWL
jgi:CRP/FNR family transcriptional regulator, cyclic AMP receptor protein